MVATTAQSATNSSPVSRFDTGELTINTVADEFSAKRRSTRCTRCDREFSGLDWKYCTKAVSLCDGCFRVTRNTCSCNKIFIRNQRRSYGNDLCKKCGDVRIEAERQEYLRRAEELRVQRQRIEEERRINQERIVQEQNKAREERARTYILCGIDGCQETVRKRSNPEVKTLCNIGDHGRSDPRELCNPHYQVFLNRYIGRVGYQYNKFQSQNSEEKKAGAFYFGFELELEIESSMGAPKAICDIMGEYIHTKRDGSLRNGIEICTPPMTAEFWRSKLLPRYSQMLTEIRKLGVQALESCGLHVHIDKDSFSRFHLRKFIELIHNPGNRKQIVAIAGRAGSRWANFDPTYDKKNLKDSLNAKCYAIPNKYIINRPSKFGTPQAFERYHAVNTSLGRGTIEVRMFASTTDIEVLLARLQFIRAAYLFSLDNGFTEMTFSKFHEFLIINDGYKELKNYIENMDNGN